MLWDLIREGHIIAGLIGLGSVGAIIYLAVVGMPIPEALITIAAAVVGYYFRTGVEAAVRARRH